MDNQPNSAAPGQPPQIGFIGRAIVALVEICSRSAWTVIVAAFLIAGASAYYAATHFAINTNTNDFLSAKLPWRQRLAELDKAFPQRHDDIIVVIDGKTPELTEMAAQKLLASLSTRKDLFENVTRPDSGPYFDQVGLMFQPVAEVQRSVGGLMKTEPFLAALTSDPSLRGVTDAFSYVNRGVRSGAGTFEDFSRPILVFSGALEDVLAGRKSFFSWQALFSGTPPDPRQLRHFLSIKPILDYAALQPGLVPSNFIRQSARELGLTPQDGVTVRLTGPVPLADEEFSTVKEGSALNGAITGLIVLFIIWRALRSARIVLAVALGVIVGLCVTAAIGLLMVGALNLISIAFAVLFVGIGVDFGIQFSVRYRQERFVHPDFNTALRAAAVRAGRPLALAAAATTCGFYSFLPTDYRGVSELGLIAGTGMIIAFFSSVTVLPALLTVLKPPAEQDSVGYKFLAPVDEFLARHRYAVVIGTLAVAFAGTPLLAHLRFDFNPLNLRAKDTEAVMTLDDLTRSHNPAANAIDILAPSLDATKPLVAKLEKLPQVAGVLTIDSLVPVDQDKKLPIIEHAAKFLLPLFDPTRRIDAPSDYDVAAMNADALQFDMATKGLKGAGADAARHLADLMRQLASAPPEKRAAARARPLPPLNVMLEQLHRSLEAKPTTVADIPLSLQRDWVSADWTGADLGLAPKGDQDDNDVMRRFAKAVQAVAPNATGEPIAIQELGDTVIRAFIEAGNPAPALNQRPSVHRSAPRERYVPLTLVPLLLAGS